jgi:dTDP-4-amino-4,6-dideoxy-D-galactose acyltransferase
MSNLCQLLDWDSNFYGFKIARLTADRLTKNVVKEVLNWCSRQDVKCLYLLTDNSDAETIGLAEDHQFRFVDIRVTLNLQIPDRWVGKGIDNNLIGLSTPDDIPALRSIAKVSHHDSRFYFDRNFPRHLSDSLYETWIDKSCKGYADAVLVSRHGGVPVGYITCHKISSTEGSIGLFAISQEHQGKGLGGNLIENSLCLFASQGIKQVSVVTQGRNIVAQKTYQRFGFRTANLQLWYHRWFIS